jgi:hypothetical protein
MNKKLKICLNVVCVLFALSCSNSKESSSENNSIITVSPDENLKSYYDTLSLIKTPLKINWQYWDSTIQRYMIANGPIKGSNIFDNPFAKVFDNKNYKAIIFISPDESGSPALVTFDRNDSPIDTIFLLGDISSNNPEQWTIEEAEIMENQTIQLLDSISQWKLTSDGARIPDTKKSTIEVKKYKISKSGEIKEKK